MKYTPSGGTVTLRARAADERVLVDVSDSGVGIPTGLGDHIFEPFVRVKGTRTQRGEASTGLGLALVRSLVDAQDAEISYLSEAGRGTTFTVSFPTAAVELATSRAGRQR